MDLRAYLVSGMLVGDVSARDVVGSDSRNSVPSNCRLRPLPHSTTGATAAWASPS